jgi:hypothetical protein
MTIDNFISAKTSLNPVIDKAIIGKSKIETPQSQVSNPQIPKINSEGYDDGRWKNIDDGRYKEERDFIYYDNDYLSNTNSRFNGTKVNASGIDIIREEQSSGGESRGDAVLDIVRAAAESATNPDKRTKMMNVAMDQYSKGNIVMTPQGSFVGLLATKGIENILH